MIHKPGHAQGVEFLIKELHPLQETRRQKIRSRDWAILVKPRETTHPLQRAGHCSTSPDGLSSHLSPRLPRQPSHLPLGPQGPQVPRHSPQAPGSRPGPGLRSHQLSRQQRHVLNDG